MAQLIQQGQALSTWPFSGSQSDSNKPLFQDSVDTTALRPIRVQGFSWTGTNIITVSDAAGTSLFTGGITNGLFPTDISGSYGIVTNAPLFLTTSDPESDIGGGGVLIIYGEVL